MDELAIVIPLLFFIFFPILWLGISFFLSHLGGWAQLAPVYRLNGEFQGKTWSMQSASMRFFSNYNAVLTFGANDQGLYVVPIIFFRFAHPPLFIPWYDISIKRLNSIFGYAELRFQRVSSISFRINRRLYERLVTEAGEAWPEQTDL